jgi:hypothetical protein
MTRSAWTRPSVGWPATAGPHALPVAIETTNGAVVDRC